MELLKLTLVVCFACTCLGSKHIIPIEEYETELHDLGQHVEYPETPVKVIKITKTIAVKVPVPYPVKVIEKVPYPVHIAKPYPVPVPQIVKVPQAAAAHSHGHKPEEHYPLGHTDLHHKPEHNDYHVQEQPSEHSEGHSFGGDDDHNLHSFGEEYGFDGSHYQPTHGYSEHPDEQKEHKHHNSY